MGDRWEFAPTERISTYLFTVAAGPWHTVTGAHDGIDLGLHCRRSLASHLDADAAELLEVTAQCLDFQQDRFGRRYPFGDSYDQLFVPEFNAGAMENPGAVTFSEVFVFRSRTTDDKRRQRAMVVAHEMAHMWFGDLVTMRWWDDLWLNESFAELMGFLTVDRATRFEDTWVDFSASRKAWGYRADQLPSTHPVQGDVPDNRSALLNFDGISYAKGASVLRQLMATVGEEVFFTGVRAYVERHAFANTTFDDLLAELERASGRDLHAWSRAWLQTSGVSTLRTVLDGQGAAIRQESDVLRPHRVGVGAYDRTGDALVLRERLDVEIDRRAGAGARRPAARPAAAQRRRPDVRQGALRRQVARDRPRRRAPPDRPARPGPVLGGAVGRLPRRRAAGGGVRPRGPRRCRRRARPGRGRHPARPGPHGGGAVRPRRRPAARRPGGGEPAGGARRRRPAATCS